MKESAFLKNYRNTLMELRVTQRQLEHSGITGRPAGYGTVRYDSMPRGTNDRVAASIQVQDGLEATLADLQAELADMEVHFQQLLTRARNYRDRCILRQYYHLCRTDAQVAECLDVSSRHANRLRTELLAHLDNTSMMSEGVVVCPDQAC